MKHYLSISFLAPKFHLEAIISSKITFFNSIYFLDTISSCNQLTKPTFIQYTWHHLCFVLDFLYFFLTLLYNCQMFKCRITFSKLFLSISNNYILTGSHLNAAVYGTMLSCYTILFKIGCPMRSHWSKKKTYHAIFQFLRFFANYFKQNVKVI